MGRSRDVVKASINRDCARSATTLSFALEGRSAPPKNKEGLRFLETNCRLLYTIDTMNTAHGGHFTKKERAYRELRGELLNHVFRPGDPLREIPLAAKLGVSRIPLREAIDQLVAEGLVERVPGLGSRVRRATPKILREIYEMRDVLECFT